MNITLNHFNIHNNPYTQLAVGQGDGYTLNDCTTLSQAIQDTEVDTGCLLTNCELHEQDGYAICKDDNYLSVITVGNSNDHPIAQKINQLRELTSFLHNLGNVR